MPPAAAKRLKQCRRVGVTIGLGLHEADARLLPRSLRVQQREIVDGAELILPSRKIKARECRAFGGGLRDQGIGVRLQRPQCVGDVLARPDDRAAILRRGLLEGGDGGALLVQQRAGVEQRLRDAACDAPHAGARREHVGEAGRRRAKRGRDGELRQLIRGRHADVGGCRMELRLHRTHVRPLCHKLRRQADRQVPRQAHAGQIEFFLRLVAGQPAGERGELIARLCQLLLQWRQRRAGLRKLGFLGQHVGLRGAAQCETLAHQVQLLRLVLDDVLRRGDLTAQRGLLHRGNDHVGGQREIGRLELEALILRLRREQFDLSPCAAEHVRRIRHVQCRRDQAECGVRVGLAERRTGEPLRSACRLTLALGYSAPWPA